MQQLNKVVGMFFEMLEYKLIRNCGKLINVDTKYTSQTSNECCHVSKENRQSQAKLRKLYRKNLPHL